MKKNRALKAIAALGLSAVLLSGCSAAGNNSDSAGSSTATASSSASASASTYHKFSSPDSAFGPSTVVPYAPKSDTATDSSKKSSDSSKTASSAPATVTPDEPENAVSNSKIKFKSYTAYATSNVNMRKGASTKYARVTTLKKATKVTVLSSKSGWKRVKAGSKTGWVSGSYISTKKPSVKKAAPKKATTKKAQSKVKATSVKTKARAVLNANGCSSLRIIWNSKLLGAYANGAYAMGHGGVVYLRSSMPAYRVTYVVTHECMHYKQDKAFAWNSTAAKSRLNHIWHTSGMMGLEKAADCMTKAKGITVYNYTSRCSASEMSAAKKMIAGKRP